jgi:hypothetical protein
METSTDTTHSLAPPSPTSGISHKHDSDKWIDAAMKCKAIVRIGTSDARLVDTDVPDIREDKDVIVKITAWHGGKSHGARWGNMVSLQSQVKSLVRHVWA